MKSILFRLTIICWVLLPALALAQEGAVPTLPVAVAATDSNLRYVGRFDYSNTAGPRCAWSGSAVNVHFKGTALNVLLSSTGRDFWQVFIDGKKAGTIEVLKDQKVYPAASALAPGEHVVQLVKRTEFAVGATQFLGFQLADGGQLLPPQPAPARRIEVIGDSISCGYGNEAPSKEYHFTPQTENGSIAYGALAARQLDADYLCVAWSGKKLWPNNSILDYYDKILPSELGGTTWSFDSWKPNVVLINLGTNDFGKENPEEKGWTDAYRTFLKRLRSQYPDATIYCALGTMMSDWPVERKPATIIRGYLTGVVKEFNDAGDGKIHFIDFGTQKAENGIGADWHPSAKTHELMAAQLVAQIKKDLGW